MRTCKLTLAVLAAAAAMSAFAASPLELQQQQLEMELRASGTGFSSFSAQRGELLFNAARRKSAAPGANPARFSDAAKMDKWLTRSCNDVLGRVCTSQEKGDILQYLIPLKEVR